jgi:hypothetical protein
MSVVRATWRNGQVVLDGPVTWAEGMRLVVEPEQAPELPAANGQDDSMTPEEIAHTLAAMDKIEPLNLTDDERAAWDAERRARKEWEKAHFAEHADKLRGQWE